jgi:hypothetical protein
VLLAALSSELAGREREAQPQSAANTAAAILPPGIIVPIVVPRYPKTIMAAIPGVQNRDRVGYLPNYEANALENARSLGVPSSKI